MVSAQFSRRSFGVAAAGLAVTPGLTRFAFAQDATPEASTDMEPMTVTTDVTGHTVAWNAPWTGPVGNTARTADVFEGEASNVVGTVDYDVVGLDNPGVGFADILFVNPVTESQNWAIPGRLPASASDLVVEEGQSDGSWYRLSKTTFGGTEYGSFLFGTFGADASAQVVTVSSAVAGFAVALDDFMMNVMIDGGVALSGLDGAALQALLESAAAPVASPAATPIG